MTSEAKKRAEWFRYRQDVLKAASENHVWLNAFACIMPTPEFEREIGKMVLQKLNEPESLIESEAIGTFTQKCLILRVNKS